jgi:hypothetical protein
MALEMIGTMHDDLGNNVKADKKRAHRERKHAIINERIAHLRGKYTGMTAAQRAAEARMYADRLLSAERRNEVGA